MSMASGGVGIYVFFIVGFRSVMDGFIVMAFLLMAIISFYFGIKAWWWNKYKKEIDPVN